MTLSYWKVNVSSYRKVQSDSADVGGARADGVGTRWGQASGGRLDKVGAVLRFRSAARHDDWNDMVGFAKVKDQEVLNFSSSFNLFVSPGVSTIEVKGSFSFTENDKF